MLLFYTLKEEQYDIPKQDTLYVKNLISIHARLEEHVSV